MLTIPGRGLTVKSTGPEALPESVFTITGPVVADNGKTAVIWLELSTVNEAETPLNVTLVAPFRLLPEITTDIPEPLHADNGANEVIAGVDGKAQTLNADEVVRGDGAPVEKFKALLSVSVQPADALNIAFVAEGAGVGPVPSKQFAEVPNPTKSTTFRVGHVPVAVTNEFISASFPVVALMLTPIE